MKGKFLPWLMAGVPLAVIAGLIVWAVTRPHPGMELPDQGNRHLASLTAAHEPYNSKPPTSGPHVNELARWGRHDRQIPDELQVHNLEDGGVMVQYDPGQVASSTIEELWAVVQPFDLADRHVVLAPYRGLDAPIALTAWTRLLRLSAADQAQIKQFIEAYEGTDHHVAGGE